VNANADRGRECSEGPRSADRETKHVVSNAPPALSAFLCTS
jgi:hypothetical protein